MTTSARTLWFRIGVTAIVIVGLFILYDTLYPRHRPPTDDGSLPRLPNAETPAVKR